MNLNELKQNIQGQWKSIATEVRPSAQKNENGSAKPFYLRRTFEYRTDDTFSLDIINYADAIGNVPLAKLSITGHIEWQGDHPIAVSAQNVHFIADIAYQVTPLHIGFLQILDQFAANGFEQWQLNIGQSILKKQFAPFGLAEGQVFEEFDLVYLHGNMLFWGARHVDGRAFDTETNRPTNLQIPMERV